MRNLLIVLLPILLIGCVAFERKASSAEPEWKTRELERKAKVHSLIEQLSDKSPTNRQAAFVELRDTYIRKRDSAMLDKEHDRSINSEAGSYLWDLFVLTEFSGHWRLPNKGWTNEICDCAWYWQKEIEKRGCEARLSPVGPQSSGLRLTLPVKSEYSPEVIKLILDLEPETLILEGGGRESISENTVLGTLEGPRELSLRNTKVTGLPPLKGMCNLWTLDLEGTAISDLTPPERNASA